MHHHQLSVAQYLSQVVIGEPVPFVMTATDRLNTIFLLLDPIFVAESVGLAPCSLADALTEATRVVLVDCQVVPLTH